MATLPDKLTPHGRTVLDADIQKHFRPGPTGTVYHLFRREHREIVDYYLKGVLPSVEGDNPKEDNSKQWHFRLRSPAGMDLLPRGRPLAEKGGIPQPAIDSLEAKIDAFLAGCAKGAPAARELVKHFRLPDPEKQPEMYRLVGKKWQPQLTVLWGFDFPKDGGTKVLPSEAISALRKRQCHPFWPVFRHLILMPIILLVMATLGCIYGPRGYQWVKVLRDSKVQRHYTETINDIYIPSADKLVSRAKALVAESTEVQAAVEKKLNEALALQKENESLEHLRPLEVDYSETIRTDKSDRDDVASELEGFQSGELAKLSTAFLSPMNSDLLKVVQDKAADVSVDLKTVASTLEKAELDRQQLDAAINSSVNSKQALADAATKLAKALVRAEEYKDELDFLSDRTARIDGSDGISTKLGPKLAPIEAVLSQVVKLSNADVDKTLLGRLRQDLADQYTVVTEVRKSQLAALNAERLEATPFIPIEQIDQRIKEINAQLAAWQKLWSAAGLLSTAPKPASSL